MVVASSVVFLASCANPVNRVTSDRDAETCVTAERDRRLDVAEEACYRALVNVDLGNLGPELKSQRLYNLARIKRLRSKPAEAEDLLKQSLALEEKLSSPTDPKIGQRLIELSLNLAAQNKWSEGRQYLERALPVSDQLLASGSRNTAEVRKFVILVLTAYGEHFRNANQPRVAERFEKEAAALR